MKKPLNIKKFLLPNIPYVFIALFATKLGQAWRLAPGTDFSGKALHLMEGFATAFSSLVPSFHPIDLCVGVAAALLIRLIVYVKGKNAKKFRKNLEYGSARWGKPEDIAPYVDPKFENNVILTQTERLMMSNRPKDPKTARNKNVLVVGGSGSGKTRFFIKPNLMQLHSSYVVTDPKGSIAVECGKLMLRNGYKVKIFNSINFKKSHHYNPFAYIHSEKDILKLVTTLIANTKGDGKSGDDFWQKAETLLYTALIGYIHYEAPEEEQNFATLIEFINAMEVREDDETFENNVDLAFKELASREPNHFAVRQYKKYKLAAGKTAKSILISVGVRLAAFNLPQIAKLTNTDELDLSSMGERKVALFCCIPDADTSLNYLVGMIYSQLFQTLYYMADRVHGGALPVPVNCIMDEFPNVSLPNEFEKILATCRSRSIYCSIIIQNMSQLKALFKDSWESLVGNCDEFLYLGGNEKETHKYVSELLGKETIDTNTYGQTKGKSGSYSTNFQQSGRELLQPDEVRMLDNQNALLFIRGERPILDAKYDLMKHPNIRYTEDGGAGPFNYAKAPLAHDDFTFDETRYNDYELLLDEDIIGELF